MEEENKVITFKEYLDSITNLLTVFGIFNALFIFSANIEDNTASTFMLPTFLVLSMFIWYELIIYSLKHINKSKKIEFFCLLLAFIGIGMVWYFIVKFKPLLLILSFQFGLYLLVATLAFIFFKIASIILRKKLSFKNDGMNVKIKFLILIVSLILTILIIRPNIKYIVPFLDKIIPEIEKTK